MTRFLGKRRKPSTVHRDNEVLNLYDEIVAELGEYAALVPRSFIYEKISDKTGLCIKTIAFIINHVVRK